MWVVVGVSGVTCGGKTTLARALFSAVPGARLVSQDDYFLPPDDKRHTWIPELGHINWEIMTALDMDRMWRDVTEILATPPEAISVLVLEGFLILNDPRVVQVCHLKYHLTLTREQCWARRSVRTYDPPDVPGFFERCVWPEYKKHRQEMLRDVPDIRMLDGANDIQSIVDSVLGEVRCAVAERELHPGC